MLLVARLEHHVESRLERILRRARGARLGEVQHRGATRRRRIGDHEAGEPPVALQLAVEQSRILGRRRAIDRVVCAHDRTRAAFANRRDERRVVHLARGIARRGRWDSCRVRLRRRSPRSASASSRRPLRSNGRTNAIAICEVRYGSSPYVSSTRPHRTSLAMLITGDSTSRMPAASRLARHRRGHPPHQRRIERRREPDRLGKRGRPLALEPVQRLLERHDGNAKPRLFDEVLLDRVDALRVRAGGTRLPAVRRPGARTIRWSSRAPGCRGSRGS